MSTQTTTAKLPVFHQTAPWNAKLTNPYKTRWTEWNGRYFKLTYVERVRAWDVDEVDAAGNWIDYCKMALNLSHGRDVIVAIAGS